ncbi:MAG: site-specific DNA-methyltransferase [Sphaerochaeta sp.]|jgi:site-specific DNA-methyltransferase (adenine-specific)|nr:site-specific DNA-methyltransferase [Sphaerochaeta sp.]
MSEPHYRDEAVTLYHGDCLDVMRDMPDASVDAVVTDPPYDLTSGKKGGTGVASLNVNSPAGRSRISTGGFMGREWDATGIAFDPATWAECLRVLKPGGHMLAFGHARTWHRLACAIEDAGFEMRDSIAWLYGTGFPKSLDVSKAIDKAEGATGTFGGPKSAAHAEQLATGRARRGQGNEGWERPWMDDPEAVNRAFSEYLPGSEKGRAYKGWGTALKPAFEPIVVARKPLAGTVAANVLRYGTGALNIDATRIHTEGSEARAYTVKRLKPGATLEKTGGSWRPTNDEDLPWEAGREYEGETKAGRWPPNVVLDESQAAELDKQTGTYGLMGYMGADDAPMPEVNGDSGGASRFFPTFRYEAKAPTSERPRDEGTAHPTVKPVDLMRWLVRLVTPPNGTVLDPFAGTGTTAEACIIEGFRCILVEKGEEYLPLIVQRLTKPIQPALDLGGVT